MGDSERLYRDKPQTLSQEQILHLDALSGLEADFIQLCRKIGNSRELSLAITNMQQAAFWAKLHVTG